MYPLPSFEFVCGSEILANVKAQKNQFRPWILRKFVKPQSPASLLRILALLFTAMYSRLPSRCFKSSIIRRHALNGLPLNKQQCRGVKITRFALSFPPYFPAENAQRKNLDRSYDKLLSETESDVQELQNATPPSHQAHNVLEGDAIDGAQSSKWDSIRQKCDYTLSKPLWCI